MHIDTARIWQAGMFTLRHITSALVIFGVIGYLAKPHAQDFVRDAVDDRIEKLEMQMDNVQRSMMAQQRAQDVMQNDLGHLKEIQQDTKRDTRIILQSLQGMRRELRQD